MCYNKCIVSFFEIKRFNYLEVSIPPREFKEEWQKMKNTEAIATIIKIARVANNYRAKELAELSQVSYTHISELEKGYKYVSDSVLEKIAKACNLTIMDINDLLMYYESLRTNEVRKYRLTLLMALEIIESNT